MLLQSPRTALPATDCCCDIQRCAHFFISQSLFCKWNPNQTSPPLLCGSAIVHLTWWNSWLHTDFSQADADCASSALDAQLCWQMLSTQTTVFPTVSALGFTDSSTSLTTTVPCQWFLFSPHVFQLLLWAGPFRWFSPCVFSHPWHTRALVLISSLLKMQMETHTCYWKSFINR